MRGKALSDVLNSVRAEARISLLPAHSIQNRDAHIIMLQREQERLWEEFNWPHLRVRRVFPIAAGQYLYAPPSDVTIDRIEQIEVKDGGVWKQLHPEILDADYTIHDSALDQRSWPVRRWQVVEQDQIEVWPIPDSSGDPTTQEGYLKVTGIRNLAPFAADGDRADLDDRMLALYVGGALLAAGGAKDANLKLAAAEKLYARLRGAQMKNRAFNMFGTTRDERGPRRMIVNRYVPPT